MIEFTIFFIILAIFAQAVPVPMPVARAMERYHRGPVSNGAPCWKGESEGVLTDNLCVITKRFVNPDGVVSALHDGNILSDVLSAVTGSSRSSSTNSETSSSTIPILSGLSILDKRAIDERFLAPHAPGGLPSVINDAVAVTDDLVERGLLGGTFSGTGTGSTQEDIGNFVKDTESVVSGIATLGGPTHDGLLPLLGLRSEVEGRNFIKAVTAAAEVLERHGLFKRESSDGARRVFGELVPGRGVGFGKRDLLGLGTIANGLGVGTGTGELLSSTRGGLLSTASVLSSVPLVEDTIESLLDTTTQ